ncbi:MAG: hypothetical protein LBQ54_10460 [Planctomycetaceae bacterium]|nr:hypothetical protein [Planctomycetaceae bacterium]
MNESYPKFPEEGKKILEEPINDSSLSSSDFIHVLNVYTFYLLYSESSIKALKAAQKRKDLDREQMFYVDARLAVFTVCENGLQSLEKLLAKYPEKRQCVAICGEQMALEYDGVRCGENTQSAYKCYQRIFEFCPEMRNEPQTLLNFTFICERAGKVAEVLPLLEK